LNKLKRKQKGTLISVVFCFCSILKQEKKKCSVDMQLTYNEERKRETEKERVMCVC